MNIEQDDTETLKRFTPPQQKKSGFFSQDKREQSQIQQYINVDEPTLSNGDCLFASFLQAIGINQQNAPQLRELVYESLRINRNLISNYLQQDYNLQTISVETYLSLIRQQGLWGGNPELQLLSQLSGININIRNRDGSVTSIIAQNVERNNNIPEITLRFNGTHYVPEGNFAFEETQPNNSLTFLRMQNSRQQDFGFQIQGEHPPITLEAQQQQAILIQDEGFIEYARGPRAGGGNLDIVLQNIAMAGGQNLEEHLFNLRQIQEQNNDNEYDFIPIIFQKDFFFKDQNIYRFPHCQDHLYGQIQGSNIMQEAYHYLSKLHLTGIKDIPEEWNKGNNSKKRAKFRYKKIQKVSKYYVQECGMGNCGMLRLYQRNVKKGKEQKDCRVLTINERKQLIKLVHKNHEKANQMAQHIWNMGAHWYGIEKDCKEYIDNCEVCVQEYKKQLKRAPGEFQNPQYPNFRNVIDCVEISHNIAKQYIPGLTKNSKIIILTIIDAFSKKANAYYIPNKSGATMRDQLSSHYGQNEPPEQILSDNGTEFINQNVQQLMDQLGVEYIHGRPYHPQTQGVIERFNQTIQQYLYRRASDDELNQQNQLSFQEVLNQVVMSYNNRIHSSHGLTPNVAHRLQNEECKKFIERMKSRFPKNRYNSSLKKGDKILVLSGVYLAQGRKNLLVRQKLKGKGKRIQNQTKFSLTATVTDDSSFNIKIKFDPDQQFDSEQSYIIPAEFVKKVTQEVVDKMTKKDGESKEKKVSTSKQQQKLQLQPRQQSQKKLKPCLICYDTDNLNYTQCCNQPLHLQCYYNAINHQSTCPYCRTNMYLVQQECLVDGRQYLEEEIYDTEDEFLDSQDSNYGEEDRIKDFYYSLPEIREEVENPLEDNKSEEFYYGGDTDEQEDETNDQENQEDSNKD